MLRKALRTDEFIWDSNNVEVNTWENMIVERAEQTWDDEPFELVESLLLENVPQRHGRMWKPMNAGWEGRLMRAKWAKQLGSRVQYRLELAFGKV
jgi:hypothetical protein